MFESKNRLNNFFISTASVLIKFRWIAIISVVIVTALFTANMKNLESDNSSDIWFVDSDESILRMKQFEKDFGNDDFVNIFLKADASGKFTPEMLKDFKKLGAEIKEKVTHVKEITWLGNVEWIESTKEKLKIEPFMGEIPDNQKEIDQLLDKALTEPSYAGALLNDDKSLISMQVELYKYDYDSTEENPEYAIALDMMEVFDKYKNLDIIAVGGPIASYKYDTLVAEDGSKFFLMTVVIMFALLLWLGRGLRGLLVPIMVVVIPVFWAMGTMPILGFSANFITMSMPTILICVGIADSMHYISAFHDKTDAGLMRKPALMESLGSVGGAILLTTLTTAIGFLSFMTTSVKPYKEMGIYVAIGVVYTMIATIMLVVSFYSFGRDEVKPAKKRKNGKGDIFDKFLDKIYSLVLTHPVKIVAIFTALLILSIYGMSLAKVETNTMKLVKKGNPLREENDFISEKMGGVLSLEFIVNTKREDGIKSADFMQRLDKFHHELEKVENISKVTSVSTIIKKMRRAMHNNDESFYSIPEKDNTVSQYLFMYEMSGGDQMDTMVTFTSDKTRVTAMTRSISTLECRLIQQKADELAKQIFGDKAEVNMSGGLYRLLRLNDIFEEGQKSSFIAALIAIGIVMMLAMRSFKLGLISMLPNIFPVLISLGILGLLGIYVDVLLLTFAPVIIGVSVDDTIHFFLRFKNEFQSGYSYRQALKRTYRSVGRPIIFTSLILVIGFSPFLFSQLTGYIKDGFMMGWAFSWAILTDFLLAPALILLTKPLGKDNPHKED